MNLLRKLAVVIVAMLAATPATADFIERDFTIELGTITATGSGDVLSGIALFFSDNPFTLSVGDTLIANFVFDTRQRVQVFDMGDPTIEIITGGFFTALGDPSPQSIVSTILGFTGVRGNANSGPFSEVTGNGGGLGVVSFGNFTDTQFSFTGFRFQTTILSSLYGYPATFESYSGMQLNADRIRILPVPEPSTLALVGIGLLGMAMTRRRKKV